MQLRPSTPELTSVENNLAHLIDDGIQVLRNNFAR
jgi:hypothetical protein